MVEIVYILGSTRSGTSALRNGLGETRFSGYGGGHLTPILNDIVSSIRHHKEDGVGVGVPGNGLFQLRERVLLRHLFHGYEEYLVKQMGTRSLMDKTPTISPIHAAPHLNLFHQKPMFLHCSRRHVDNVQSKIKKFTDRSFEEHCREWADCNLAWHRSRESLDGNFVEFDFYDLVTEPECLAKRIGEYVALNDQEVEAFSRYLVSKRPQAQADRDLTKFLKLSEIDWTDQEKEIFQRICGPIGEIMGYGMEDYFA